MNDGFSVSTLGGVHIVAAAVVVVVAVVVGCCATHWASREAIFSFMSSWSYWALK